eukprot:12273022-Alexandrium_andersonii.AAC.1
MARSLRRHRGNRWRGRLRVRVCLGERLGAELPRVRQVEVNLRRRGRLRRQNGHPSPGLRLQGPPGQ